jgi:hypothetical protein
MRVYVVNDDDQRDDVQLIGQRQQRRNDIEVPLGEPDAGLDQVPRGISIGSAAGLPELTVRLRKGSV